MRFSAEAVVRVTRSYLLSHISLLLGRWWGVQLSQLGADMKGRKDNVRMRYIVGLWDEKETEKDHAVDPMSVSPVTVGI